MKKQLSRREREIMDVVFSLGSATADAVRDRLADEPSNSTVRTLMRILETKGELTHTTEGKCYVYRPVRPRAVEGRRALRRLVGTFFGGSVDKTVAALLDPRDTKLSDAELDQLERLIRTVRAKGKTP